MACARVHDAGASTHVDDAGAGPSHAKGSGRAPAGGLQRPTHMAGASNGQALLQDSGTVPLLCSLARSFAPSLCFSRALSLSFSDVRQPSPAANSEAPLRHRARASWYQESHPFLLMRRYVSTRAQSNVALVTRPAQAMSGPVVPQPLLRCCATVVLTVEAARLALSLARMLHNWPLYCAKAGHPVHA